MSVFNRLPEEYPLCWLVSYVLADDEGGLTEVGESPNRHLVVFPAEEDPLKADGTVRFHMGNSYDGKPVSLAMMLYIHALGVVRASQSLAGLMVYTGDPAEPSYFVDRQGRVLRSRPNPIGNRRRPRAGPGRAARRGSRYFGQRG